MKFDLLAQLKEAPWMQALTPELATWLISRVKIKTFVQGELVIKRGDLGAGVFVLLAGSLKVGAFSRQGKESVLTFLQPGSLFGEMSLLDGLPRSHDTWAHHDVSLAFIEQNDFDYLIKNSSDFYHYLVVQLCKKLRLTFSWIEDTSLLPLEGRLAKRLLMLAAMYENSGKQGAQTLAVSQEELAMTLGVSRASVNKLLKSWQDENLITMRYGSIGFTSELLAAKLRAIEESK